MKPLLALVGTSFCLLACAVTDTGNPPVDPMKPVMRPTIDATKISSAAFAGPMSLQLMGLPGSIDPPEGVVRVVNLDAQDDPTEGDVERDGSFALFVDANFDDELRIQVRADTSSRPLDLLGPEYRPTPQVLPCFVVDRELDAGAIMDSKTLELRVRNECSHALSISSPTFRRMPSDWQVVFDIRSEFVLPEGEERRLTLQMQAGGSDFEEVFFLTVQSPMEDRRAITLRARISDSLRR